MPTSVHEGRNQPFLMEVESGVGTQDRSVVVLGKILQGKATPGKKVELIGLSRETKQAVIVDVDVLFKGTIVLQGLTKDDIIRGQVLATPGMLKPYTTFAAEVTFSTAQARVDPQPFLGTFRSYFHLRGTDIYGTMWLPEGTTKLSPGDQMQARIELQQPSALEVGLAFGIGRLVGKGRVLELLG